MNPKAVKKILNDTIQAMTDCKWFYSARPGKDNTRNRKFPFHKMIPAILALGGGTLNHEIIDFFGLDPSIGTSSAFIQRRSKIIPEAFEFLFHDFSKNVDENKRFRGLRLLAVDGSDLQIAANPNDPDSYYPGVNEQKAYNLLHINAMYDLQQHIYVDALVQKSRNADESGALTAMVDRSAIDNALLLADRGYESYNNLAHIQEKGWKFLIRIKDGTGGIASGLTLPDADEFDVPFHLKLTNKQTNEVKQLLKDKNHYKAITGNIRFDYLPRKSRKHDPTKFYDLSFRIVRFPISETTCETIITNLDESAFPLQDTGWEIQVSGKVFNETKNHKDSYNIAARPYLPYINDIVSKAILLDSHAIEISRAKSENSLLMHSLYAVADIGKGPEIIKLYVEEMNNPNSRDTNKRAYQLQNIEKYRPAGKSSQNTASSRRPATGIIHTVADLFAAVKRMDANFNPNPESKVVNDDGTPKVVYHGTNKDFTVFQSASGMYWFSETEDYAEEMAYERGGKNVIPAYLSIKNPYIAKLSPNQFSNPNYEHAIIRNAKAGNHDGIILKNDSDNELVAETFYIVFGNTQIKSATDNIGTFDGSNPDIR